MKRKVCTRATIAAMPSAVIIRTDDGESIVCSPKLARKLAQELREMAEVSENIAPKADAGSTATWPSTNYRGADYLN